MNRRAFLSLGLAAGVSAGIYGLLPGGTPAPKRPFTGLVCIDGAEDWHVWAPQVSGADGIWVMHFKYWPKSSGAEGWRDSGAGALAVATQITGPYKVVASGIVNPGLRGRPEGVPVGWKSSTIRNAVEYAGRRIGAAKWRETGPPAGERRSEIVICEERGTWQVIGRISPPPGQGLPVVEDPQVLHDGRGWVLYVHSYRRNRSIVAYRSADAREWTEDGVVLSRRRFHAWSTEMPWRVGDWMFCGVRVAGQGGPFRIGVARLPDR